MRIDYVNNLDIKGLRVEKALEALCKHCNDTAIQVMKMNNEIEDLKQEIYQLKNGQR